jgi:cysteine sulfinate desulfinase/cysteine desulfurase-like protein
MAARRPARRCRALADPAVSEIYLDYNASTPIDPRVAAVMGVPPEEGMGALRFSLGRGTTEAEIREVAERLADVAETVGLGASVGGG